MSQNGEKSEDAGPGPAEWWVESAGRRYGPYTRPQLRAYVDEGRIGLETKVSRTADPAWRTAADIAWLNAALITRASPAAIPQPAPPTGGRFLVWAQIDSGGHAFEAALRGLGPSVEIGAGFWALRAKVGHAQVRAALMPAMGRRDRLLTADLSRNKIGWLNLGPEAESRLRAIWAEPAAAAAND